MNLANLIFGPPLATEDDKSERIGPVKGIPIFGLDALSSAAYGPEAALTLLIPLGMAGVAYIWPISVSDRHSARHCLFLIPPNHPSLSPWRRFLRRQRKSRHLARPARSRCAHGRLRPHCRGRNFRRRRRTGLRRSVAPTPHTLLICLAILFVLTFVNLRGIRETGGIFMIPTYLFIACLLGMIAIGVFKVIASGGHPAPVIAPPKLRCRPPQAYGGGSPPRLRQRLHCHDRRRSRQQWRHGLQEIRPTRTARFHPHHHHRHFW